MPTKPNTPTSASAPLGNARARNTPAPKASEPSATRLGNSSGCHHDGSLSGRKFSVAAYARRLNPPRSEAALVQAGFTEAAIVWRYLDDTMVGALR